MDVNAEGPMETYFHHQQVHDLTTMTLIGP